MPGFVFTEIDAAESLTGAKAELIAGGGICGAEGSIRIAVSGTADQVSAADCLLGDVISEPAFQF